MDFADRIEQLSTTVKKNIQYIDTEEATKHSLIMPFIEVLGYDVRNPTEVVPEYTADVGSRKGDKVDYAILKDGIPIILIECKICSADLNEEHAKQLKQYFQNTDALIGILTNGLEYRFYAGLDKENVMDERPFFVFDIKKPHKISELKAQFTKENFDADEVVSNASELKYLRELKAFLTVQFDSANDDFIKYLGKQVYEGSMTKKVVEQFTGIVRRALQEFLNEKVKDVFDKASSRLEDTTETEQPEEAPEEEDDGIVTTEEEIQGHLIIRAILAGTVGTERVTMRDHKSYCSILFDNNRNKHLCRFYFDGRQKYLQVFDDEENFNKHPIEGLADLYGFSNQLIETVKRYLPEE
ncbi:type I restriction enzyme HsdR N-terminal domain-containing protein [bacterium]|nr:type I restriction enzyme HsdR N-terminal domain-containing protein [bacterium]